MWFLLEPCLRGGLPGGVSAPGSTALATAVTWSELPLLRLLRGRQCRDVGALLAYPPVYHGSVLVQAKLKGETRGTVRSGQYKETNRLWTYFQQPNHLSALCFVHIVPKGSFKEQAGEGQRSFLSLYLELLSSRAAGEKEQIDGGTVTVPSCAVLWMQT